MQLHNVRDFPQAKLNSQITARFPLFFINEFGVKMILFTKPLPEDANDDFEIGGTFLSQCHLELWDFSTGYISHCSKCPRISASQVFFQVLLN